MRAWFITDSARFGREKSAIEQLVTAEGWFMLGSWGFHQGNLAVTGEISAHDTPYAVRLIFPDQFPDVPAWVEPIDDVKWSAHQYGSGGALCLELRPDNWVPSASGVDVLRSAFNLLKAENPLGAAGEKGSVPSAHDVGEVQSYAWGQEPVIIGAECYGRLQEGTVQDLKALRWMSRDNVWPIVLHDAQDRASPRRPPAADLNSWRFEIPTFVSSNWPAAEIDDRQALIGVGGFEGTGIEQLAEKGPAVVVFSAHGNVAVYHLLDDGKPFRRKFFIAPGFQGVRSGRAAGNRKLSIVGMGSVGSKIAESVLRSGVFRLDLIDGDVLLPGNLERHALDWRHVGYRKVHGVRNRLLEIVPGADVQAVPTDLSWQQSPRLHAQRISAVADADVIVDATGDPATALFLGAIAHGNGKPFVSVELFEGGIGALVAACVPGRDPSYAASRAAFLAWCEKENIKPPASAPGQYAALDDRGTPIVADDAAATTLAGHAARVILDILDGRSAKATDAWLLLGFAEAWMFDGHGHTIRMGFGGPLEPDPQIDGEAQAFIVDLLRKEFPGESASAS